MKLGVSMWSYFHAWKAGRINLPGFIAEAKRIGADGVELLDFFYGDIESDRATALAALAQAGIPCSVFSVAQNFAMPSAEEREAQLQKIVFGVDEAQRYNTDVVRVFAGDVSEGVSFDQAREWIVEGLSRAADYAHDRGVRLALENHGTLAGKSDQVIGIIKEVRERCGHDALWANPDTGNFLLVGELPHTGVEDVAPFAAMVHFKDFRPAPEGHDGFAYSALDGSRFVGTAIGEGAVNLPACVAALRDAGFAGWLNVEYEAEEDPFTGVERSVANAKRILST